MKVLIHLFLFGFVLLAQKIEPLNNEIEFFFEGVKISDITGYKNEIWFASNGNGIFCYNYSENLWVNYSVSSGNLDNDFFFSIAVSEKYVFAGSTDGLFIFDRNKERWTKRKFAKGGQLSNWIRSLKYDEYDEVVWIGRFRYLTKFDIITRRFTDYDLTINNDFKTNTIKAISVDGDSLVWFGTEAGVHKYDKSFDLESENSITFFDNRLNYFQGEGEMVSISKILFDRNYIWLGLDEFVTPDRPEYNVGGLYKFDRENKWYKFDTNSGLRGNGIFDLERTGNYIWVSMYQFGENTKDYFGRGIAIIDRLSNIVIKVFELDNSRNTESIYFDGKFIWFGTDNGIAKLKLENEFSKLEK